MNNVQLIAQILILVCGIAEFAYCIADSRKSHEPVLNTLISVFVAWVYFGLFYLAGAFSLILP